MRSAGLAADASRPVCTTGAKYLQLAVLGLGGVALLMWPGPVRWDRCVALGALLAGGLASVQWAYYKKHM